MGTLLNLNRQQVQKTLSMFTIQVLLPHCLHTVILYCFKFPLVIQLVYILLILRIIFIGIYKPKATPNSFNAASNPEGRCSFSSLSEKKKKKKKEHLKILAISKADLSEVVQCSDKAETESVYSFIHKLF